ncbi:hypothetical protein ENBRE01_0597 [Enteropsectra breve]|nr:hypothetical protein ENBRE01_0597 [Enteropsectra breve]
MKDVQEDLKTLKNCKMKDPPELEELDEIALASKKAEVVRLKRPYSKVTRMLPACYQTFNFKGVPIESLHDETLFFIFYAMTETDLQIKAYNELLKKGYLFSKKLLKFLTADDELVADNRQHTVIVFNPSEWEKSYIDIMYDKEFITSLQGRDNYV